MRFFLKTMALSFLFLFPAAPAHAQQTPPLFNATSGKGAIAAPSLLPPPPSGMKTTVPYIAAPETAPAQGTTPTPAVQGESTATPAQKTASPEDRIKALEKNFLEKSKQDEAEDAKAIKDRIVKNNAAPAHPDNPLVFKPRKDDTPPAPPRAFNIE